MPILIRDLLATEYENVNRAISMQTLPLHHKGAASSIPDSRRDGSELALHQLAFARLPGAVKDGAQPRLTARGPAPRIRPRTRPARPCCPASAREHDMVHRGD